jgi:hypothetical protein
MSNTTENSLTRTYRGKFGKDFVLRNRGDVSIMAKTPKKNSKEPAESQVATRRKFKTGTRWVKEALKDPDKLAFYQSIAQGMKTPYVMALSDYLHAPTVDDIDVSNYNGNVGDKIMVVATDKIKVKSVAVAITSAIGELIETGPCTEDLSADAWCYVAKVVVSDLAGVIVKAVAEDIPCHTGTLELTL